MNKEKTIGELAELIGGTARGDKTSLITDVGTLEEASESEITFIASPKNLKYIKDSHAGGFIVPKETKDAPELSGRNIIVVDEPYNAIAKVLDILRPPSVPEPGLSDLAEISEKARIGSGVAIMAFVVIEAGVTISDNAVIYPGVYIARDSSIGARSVIHSNVSIREASSIGDDVTIHANSVIGSDGFGYTKDNNIYIKIPQRGSVRIEDGCEIGASVTIDRGTIGKTIIGKGTKIDNLVQIAHNVEIGENSVLVAQVGVAGSTKIGKRAQIGGQAGLVGHITLGDDASVGASSAVLGDVEKEGFVSGYPAMPHNLWLRVQSLTKKLPDMKKQLKEMETRLAQLESNNKERKEQ